MKTTANSRDQISPARDEAVGAGCNVPLQDAWQNFGPRTGTARDEAPKLRFAAPAIKALLLGEAKKSSPKCKGKCYVERNITFSPIYITLKKILTYSALRKWIGNIRFMFRNLLF